MYNVSTGAYTFFKKAFFAVPPCSIKMFHLQQVQGIIDSPWCNNSCRAYQECGQGSLYSFDQKKLFFLLSYVLPTPKKNLTTRKFVLT